MDSVGQLKERTNFKRDSTSVADSSPEPRTDDALGERVWGAAQPQKHETAGFSCMRVEVVHEFVQVLRRRVQMCGGKPFKAWETLDQ